MKRLLLILFLSSFLGLAFAQTWEVMKVGDLEHYPNDGFFIDVNTGWYVGDEGVVVKTTDGGNEGITVREPVEGTPDWKDVEFANANIGYSCGEDGYIFKTTDGGLNWTMVGDTANYKNDLKALSVVNEDIVYFAGMDSIVLKTINGGTDFTKIDYGFNEEDLDGGIAFIDENLGVVLADGNGGNTWYTHDGGANWTHIQIGSLFPYGLSSTRIYEVSGGGDSTFAIGGYHHCIFISNDGGKTYTHCGDYTTNNVQHKSIQVLDKNTIIAGGSDGMVVKTTDGGANWDTLNVGSGQTVVFVDFLDTNNGYVFSFYGQWFKTTDGGVNWQPLRDWPNIGFRGIGIPEANKIVLTAYGGGEMTISEDGGVTWSYPDNFATGTAKNTYECEFIDANNGLIAGTGGHLERTTDGGTTWTFIDNPMAQNNKSIFAIRYINSDIVLAGGSSGYIIKSEDGGQTWVKLINNGGTSSIYDLWQVSETQVVASQSSGKILSSNAAIDTFNLVRDYGSMRMYSVESRGDVGIVTSGYKDHFSIYRTTGAKWDSLEEVFTDPDNDDLNDVEFITDSLVYVVGDGGKIYKSEDAGLTWTPETSPTENYLEKIRYDNTKLWAVGGGSTILRAYMTSLVPISGLYINEFMASNTVTIQDEHGDYEDWFEIYNSNGYAVDVGGLYVMDDFATPADWWQIPTGKPDSTTIPAGGFLLLWADKESEEGVLHTEFRLSSTNGEQIGIVQIIGTDTTFIDSLSFGPQCDDTSYGRINDGGAEWALFSTATPGETNANGIIVGIGNNQTPVVTEFKLSQNYPNPFNPTTTISYSIKKAGKVNLSVYNVAGQKVATLIDKNMKACAGKITWDASRLASGVYFYRLTSGDFKEVKKMLLLK